MLKSVIRAAVLVSFCLLAGATSAQDIKREITKVAGDVLSVPETSFHFFAGHRDQWTVSSLSIRSTLMPRTG